MKLFITVEELRLLSNCSRSFLRCVCRVVPGAAIPAWWSGSTAYLSLIGTTDSTENGYFTNDVPRVGIVSKRRLVSISNKNVHTDSKPASQLLGGLHARPSLPSLKRSVQYATVYTHALKTGKSNLIFLRPPILLCSLCIGYISSVAISFRTGHPQ